MWQERVQELLDGIISAQADPDGWNARVRPTLRAEQLSLDANGTLALSLPPQLAYDIASPERLKVRLPASALARKPRKHSCSSNTAARREDKTWSATTARRSSAAAPTEVQ